MARKYREFRDEDGAVIYDVDEEQARRRGDSEAEAEEDKRRAVRAVEDVSLEGGRTLS